MKPRDPGASGASGPGEGGRARPDRFPEDPKKRAEAMHRAIQETSDEDLPELVAALAKELGTEDPFLRFSALDVLGRLAAFREVRLEGELASKIINLGTDEDERVRAESAVAIALLPDDVRGPGARATLKRLLEDPSAGVRQEAAAALGDVKDTSAVTLLAGRLEDPNGPVRFEAAFALASLGDERGVPELVRALEKPRTRLDACEGLRRLGPKAKLALPELLRIGSKLFLFWGERLTVWATIYALGERPQAAERIIQRARARSREERAYALGLLGTHKIVEGAPVLERIAKDPKDPHQDTAVRALGDLGEPGGAPVLLAVAEDPKAPEELRLEAIEALAKLPRAAAAGPLAALAKSPDRALAEHAKKHVPSGA